jgi:hypothetical protein
MGWLLAHPQRHDYKKCQGCGNTIKIVKEVMGQITMQELNPHNYPTTPEIDANLELLYSKINNVRQSYNIPMIVTSGLRSEAQQQQLIADGKSTASKSKHLTGQAVDIQDIDGALRDWVIRNMNLMEQYGFWFEDFGHTKGWVHFQIFPPLSGKRVFIP